MLMQMLSIWMSLVVGVRVMCLSNAAVTFTLLIALWRVGDGGLCCSNTGALGRYTAAVLSVN